MYVLGVQRSRDMDYHSSIGVAMDTIYILLHVRAPDLYVVSMDGAELGLKLDIHLDS